MKSLTSQRICAAVSRVGVRGHELDARRGRPVVIAMDPWRSPDVLVSGRRLQPTPAFRSYWGLAAERQAIFFRRLSGARPPWTNDPVLAINRFTNAYRASDRVSQYLINDVIYGSPADARSTVLRVLLFKIFNRIDTWRFIDDAVNGVTVDTFDVSFLVERLDARMAAGERLYSAAYIMPSPKLGEARKHSNHLRLLDELLMDGTVDRMLEASSLRDLYEVLVGVNSFGPFLAFQFAIDLNYSELFGFSEMDFVVAGPGARDGIAKCFSHSDGVPAEDVIRAVTDSAAAQFDAAGVEFESLWGRPLQLIDCQNLFCEVSKYARVAHPELIGCNGRTRIKQRYVPTGAPLRVGYPPVWGLPARAPVLQVGERFEGEGSSVDVADHPSSVGVADLAPHREALQHRLFDLP